MCAGKLVAYLCRVARDQQYEDIFHGGFNETNLMLYPCRYWCNFSINLVKKFDLGQNFWNGRSRFQTPVSL